MVRDTRDEFKFSGCTGDCSGCWKAVLGLHKDSNSWLHSGVRRVWGAVDDDAQGQVDAVAQIATWPSLAELIRCERSVHLSVVDSIHELNLQHPSPRLFMGVSSGQNGQLTTS